MSAREIVRTAVSAGEDTSAINGSVLSVNADLVITFSPNSRESLADARSFRGIEDLGALLPGRAVRIPHTMTDPAPTLTVDGSSLLGKGLASHG